MNRPELELHTNPCFIMATHRFIQYAVGSKKKPAMVYLRCHVKPGASKVREGITCLTDDTIELCVSAAARENEANKAVVAVLSEVRRPDPRMIPACWIAVQGGRGGLLIDTHGIQALDVAKSDLQITRGAKSRDKVVALVGKSVQDGEAECLSRLLKRLGEAAGESNGG